MPNYLAPGVYVEEIGSGLPRIRLGGNSHYAMLGKCGGDQASPFDVASYLEFTSLVPDAGETFGRAVEGFFENGGASLTIVPAIIDDTEGTKLALKHCDKLFGSTGKPLVLAFPGLTDTALQSVAADWCETRRSAFAIFDGARHFDASDYDPAADIGHCPLAALYQPWLRITDDSGRVRETAPSGFLLGQFAFDENRNGYPTAPTASPLSGVIGPAVAIGHGEHELLNPRGVNAIREFPNRGTLIWGARTLADPNRDRDMLYISSVLLMTTIEAGLRKFLKDIAFEESNAALWDQVVDAVDAALNDLWTLGALQGATPHEAFFVKCGLNETMTQSDIDAGRLICTVGIAPVKPAEFVIMNFRQKMSK